MSRIIDLASKVRTSLSAEQLPHQLVSATRKAIERRHSIDISADVASLREMDYQYFTKPFS